MPGVSLVHKGEHRYPINAYGLLLKTIAVAVVYAYFTWYEVQRSMVNCWCFEGEDGNRRGSISCG